MLGRCKHWLVETQYLIEYLLLLPIVLLVRWVNEPAALAIARWVGRAAYYVLAHDRKWCLWNLELVYGERLTPFQRERLAKKVFENIARSRVELMRFTPEWMRDHIVEFGGDATRDIVRRQRAQGTGVIVITAHLGNFELIPPHSYHTGFHGPVMYRPLNNWRVEKLMLGARARYLPDIVRRGTFSTVNFLYALREGDGVGMLVDMNTLSSPVFVDVLGIPAASPPGAAALAVTTGAPVILAMAVRQPDGKHHITFHPPFELIRTGNRKRDIELNTQQYMRAIDEYILKYPEQYNWPHPRWRLRPDGSFWTSSTPIAAARQSASLPLAKAG